MTEKTQNIIFILLLITLLVVQLYWLFKKANLKRKTLKIGLNILLWLSIVLLIFPIQCSRNENLKKIGIKDENVPNGFVSKIKDSLELEKVVSKTEFEQKYLDKNLEINLIGQNFDGEFLSYFAGKNVNQIPYFEKNKIQKLAWKGILKLNEQQEINGTIDTEKGGFLKLKFGNQTLDSIKTEKGLQQFNLSFPSFSLGKTGVELFLDETLLTEIKYFSRPAPKYNILILAENPDFETKILSDWLGKNGNSVEVQTTVTKNTQNTTNINATKRETYDLIIVTPERIGNPICQKTLKKGGAVFVLDLSENSISQINKTFNSNLKIQRITSETEEKIDKDLIALSFKFIEQSNQKILNNWPIVVTNNRIGATLITETYPLILSGDSISYRKIWGGILQLLQPVQKNNIEVAAPIIENLTTRFVFNNFDKNLEFYKVKEDTIFTKTSPINAKTTSGNYTFRSNGWQELNDSLEVFVNKNNEPYINQIFTNSALNSYTNSLSSETGMKEGLKETLPDWFRFLLCIIIFIFVWIEAKW